MSGVIPLLILTYVPELKHFYTIEPVGLETEDGIYISAYKYTPRGEKNHGGIIVTHSFFGSKLNMQPLSIELVKRGFTVLNIDFRGHGASGGFFYRSQITRDIKAAVDYFISNVPYITDLGLVGHSLGAQSVLDFSRIYPSLINATIAIGGGSSNLTGISNVLVATGLYDPGLPEETLVDYLESYTGIENLKVGQVYFGDFNNGTNIKTYVSPLSGHFTEIVDFNIIYQTIQWFEQAFNGEHGSGIVITAPLLILFSYISLFGVIMLDAVLIIYIRNYIFSKEKEDSNKEIFEELRLVSTKKLVGFYSIAVVLIQYLFFLYIFDISVDLIPLSTTSITLTMVVGAAVGTFLVYNLLLLGWKDKYSIKDLFSQLKTMSSSSPGRSLIFGALIGILSILSIGAIWHWSVQNTLPTISEIGRMVILTLLSFPFFLIKEFYFRSIQQRIVTTYRYEEYFIMVGTGLFMDNLLILFVIFVGKLNLAYIPAYTLYLLVWVIFSIIQQFTATWVYMNSKNILGSTIFMSIFYSWMLVVFFPSYGFL
ncbi:MAG: alpha/beta hydrolase family protein [Promethearchaeota archaeon]|jgi:pimeloyl-ACP methyl ester carboxylesterase